MKHISITILSAILIVVGLKYGMYKLFAQTQDNKNIPFAKHQEYIVGYWDAMRMTKEWNQGEAKDLTDAFERLQIGSASNLNYYNLIKQKYEGKDIFIQIEIAADKLEDMYMEKYSENTFLKRYRNISDVKIVKDP